MGLVCLFSAAALFAVGFLCLVFLVAGSFGTLDIGHAPIWLLGFCTVLAVGGLWLIFTRPGKPEVGE
jgi:hypothetical protein